MAPFSLCTKCSKRTRKVVRDLETAKWIYLCPGCNVDRVTELARRQKARKDARKKVADAKRAMRTAPIVSMHDDGSDAESIISTDTNKTVQSGDSATTAEVTDEPRYLPNVTVNDKLIAEPDNDAENN